jgi:hypothetical protein
MGCNNTKNESAGGGGGGGNKPAGGGGADKPAQALPTKAIAEGGFGLQNFIIDNQGKLTDFYDLDKKKIGRGILRNCLQRYQQVHGCCACR